MNIIIVDGEGWQGLYIDDLLVLENHRLELEEVLEAIGCEYKTVYPNDNWLSESGTLPEFFDEVVTEDEDYGDQQDDADSDDDEE